MQDTLSTESPADLGKPFIHVFKSTAQLRYTAVHGIGQRRRANAVGAIQAVAGKLGHTAEANLLSDFQDLAQARGE